LVTGEELLVLPDVPKRWLKADGRTKNLNEGDETQDYEGLNDGGQVRISNRRNPLGPRPMDKTAKYRKALKVCTEISSLLSLTGGSQFEQRMMVLESVLNFWTSKRECVVLPVSADGVIDGKYFVIIFTAKTSYTPAL